MSFFFNISSSISSLHKADSSISENRWILEGADRGIILVLEGSIGLAPRISSSGKRENPGILDAAVDGWDKGGAVGRGPE